MSDEILNQGPKILAQMVITLIEGPDGRPGQVGVTFPPDEILARYLLSKAQDVMADHWRMTNAPRVAPVNGSPVIPEAVRKHFRG